MILELSCSFTSQSTFQSSNRRSGSGCNSGRGQRCAKGAPL